MGHTPLRATSGGDAPRLERPFLEALGGTTRETVMGLVRELPIAEMLADRIVDGCVAIAAEAEAEAVASAARKG